MVMDIARVAFSLNAQQAEIEASAQMMSMAKNLVETQGDAIIELMESAKALELAVNPHLGSILDVSG